jgi:hypothetical protein
MTIPSTSRSSTIIQDLVKKGDVKLQYIHTEEQIANVLTKPLSKINFENFKDKIGVVQKEFPRKRE